MASVFVLSMPLHIALEHCAALDHHASAQAARDCVDDAVSACDSDAGHGEAECHGEAPHHHGHHHHHPGDHDHHHGIDDHSHDSAVRALVSMTLSAAVMPEVSYPLLRVIPSLGFSCEIIPPDWDPRKSSPQRGPPSIPVNV